MVGALSSPSGSTTSGRAEERLDRRRRECSGSSASRCLGPHARPEPDHAGVEQGCDAGAGAVPGCSGGLPRCRRACCHCRACPARRWSAGRARGRAESRSRDRSGAGSGSAPGSGPTARASARANRYSAGNAPEGIARHHDVAVRRIRFERQRRGRRLGGCARQDAQK